MRVVCKSGNANASSKSAVNNKAMKWKKITGWLLNKLLVAEKNFLESKMWSYPEDWFSLPHRCIWCKCAWLSVKLFEWRGNYILRNLLRKMLHSPRLGSIENGNRLHWSVLSGGKNTQTNKIKTASNKQQIPSHPHDSPSQLLLGT